jgi:molybdopterin-guanine dinucleotide biosynthesis protein
MLKEGKDSTKKRQQGQDKTKLYSDSEEEVENKFDKKGQSQQQPSCL